MDRFAAHMIGAAVAAYGAGFSRTTLQTHVPAFYVAGAACLVAAMAVWLIDGGRRRWSRVPGRRREGAAAVRWTNRNPHSTLPGARCNLLRGYGEGRVAIPVKKGVK